MRDLILAGLLLAMGTQFAQAKPRNITFISHRTSATKVDVGDPGLSVGNMVANTGELLDIKTNAVIGSSAIHLPPPVTININMKQGMP